MVHPNSIRILVGLHLLGGFSSKEAKLRPVFVLLLGLLAGFFGSSALINVSPVWLGFFSAHIVFAIVWILSIQFSIIPISPLRTVVVGIFDFGCGISTLMLAREVQDSQSLSARAIWLCGFFQILHIIVLGGALAVGLSLAFVRWILFVPNPGPGAPVG